MYLKHPLHNWLPVYPDGAFSCTSAEQTTELKNAGKVGLMCSGMVKTDSCKSK